MKLTLNTLILFFGICSALQSQSNVGIDIETDLSVANIRAYSVGTFDNRDVSYKGSPLIWEEWMYATILLEGNEKYSKNDYKVNFDAMSKLLYIKIGTQMYNMSLAKVKSLQVMTSAASTSTFKVVRSPESGLGLYEVVYSNEDLELLRKTNIEVGKAYYNTALDAGDNRPSLNRSISLYIYKSNQLFELPKKRKKMIDKYKGERELKDLVTFFKEKRVDLRDDEEIQSALIELYKK